MKVFTYVGWLSNKRIEGIIQGYVGDIFGNLTAIILITKSESEDYRVNKFYPFGINSLKKYD